MDEGWMKLERRGAAVERIALGSAGVRDRKRSGRRSRG